MSSDTGPFHLTEAGARRLARALFAFVVLELAVGATLQIVGSVRYYEPFNPGELGFLFAFVLFPVVGLLLAARRPGNALGWLLLAIGIVAFEPLTSYGDYALAAGLGGAEWAFGATSWTWIPVIGLSGTFVLFLFPDGHLPSPRWRWFAWAIAIGMAVGSVAILLAPGPLTDVGQGGIENPFGIEALRTVTSVATAAIVAVPIGICGAAASLVVRRRRSGPTERLQIRWLASAAIVLAVVYAGAMAVSLASEVGWEAGGGWITVLQTVAVMLFGLLPIAIGIAVLRYRLYEIDVVIRKAVIVTAIAAFVTIVYAAVVGGIGALVQTHSTTGLSFAAAAAVAVLFQPALGRARRIADRLVYGKRATPYEVLAEFSDRVGETYAADDVLPRMARVVADAVGATSAHVWLRGGDRLRVAASWPADAERPPTVTLDGFDIPALPGADAAFAVEHHGEVLGALALAMPPSDPLDVSRSKLVEDLAAQAGLVLRNVRLTEELRARLEDLQAAQKRLVEAQDEERRKLERNIHDGAQQQLVALTVKLRLAEGLVERDPARLRDMLRGLQGETQTALEDLRDLARGIYPPLLADQGLGAALEAQARKSPVPVRVEPDGIGRYPQAVEAAVYFSVLEALQNVAKYAEATQVVVSLAQRDGHLAFAVEDDGRGFDQETATRGSGLQGIADRLGALDGVVDVRSAPGAGTTISGRVPAELA